MTYTRLADEFFEDETICALHDRAYRLFVHGLVYCSRNLTDGIITPKALQILQVVLGYKVKRYAVELVAAGLWVVQPDGTHKVRNYLKYNRDSVTVREDRRKARERMKTIRGSAERSGERSAERTAERSGERSGTQSLPVLSLVVTPPTPPTNYGASANGHIDETLWRKLIHATGVTTKQDTDKLVRCVRKRKLSEHDVAYAIEAACGPGVRDRLAVALSELAKRGAA